MAVVDTVHERLCDVVAAMMGDVCARPAPRAHLSFLALGGGETEAAELAQIANALFGVSLTTDAVMRSPTPDSLARTIEGDWFENGGSATALVELMAAIADAD
jgi:hypothetical protein